MVPQVDCYETWTDDKSCLNEEFDPRALLTFMSDVRSTLSETRGDEL